MSSEKEFNKLLDSGSNILLTGGGGVGKSYLIREMFESYPRHKSIVLTASTGIAAYNLHSNACTIHSFLGLGMTTNPLEVDSIIARRNWPLVEERLKALSCLVIDEISMIRADQFRLIDLLMREARGRKFVPFGGVQMILCGDFLQLPPVFMRDEVTGGEEFVFESKSFVEGNFKTVNLTEVKRQSDRVFISILNQIRHGLCPHNVDVLLQQKTLENPLSSKALRIFPTNKRVDDWNQKELDELNSPLVQEKASVLAKNGTLMRMVIDSLITPMELELKVGCQVMITVNGSNEFEFDSVRSSVKYVNGSMGTFLGFEDFNCMDHAENHNPRLGRAQQMALVELNSTKEIVYLAKKDFYYKTPVGEHRWIDTMFTNSRGEVLTEKDFTFDNEEFDARFTQFPLRVAYAITIHKSQGLTLENLFVDCKGIFAFGQFYVAVSRAKSLGGLVLDNFNPWHVKANPRAVKFYEGLE